MDRTISADEFHRSIEGLKDYVGHRCDGIDGRLDKVNGRLDRHGAAIGRIDPIVARHDERLADHARRLEEIPDEAIGQITTLVQGFQRTAAAAEQKREDVISIPVNAKTVTALALALGTIIVSVVLAILKVAP